MFKVLISFFAKTVLLLSVAFGCHLFILQSQELPLFANKIVMAYVINAILAIGICWILFILKEKYKSQLGFLFMAGSAIKFVLFFILFYPIYKADNIVSASELFAFLVPYFLCLGMETITLAKWLNNMEY